MIRVKKKKVPLAGYNTGSAERGMEYRKLGNSALEVSLVGLGCNNFGGRMDLEASRKVVDRAIELGVNLFDTADAYGERGGSERFLGEILGARRKKIILATKFGIPMDDAGEKKGASRKYILSAIDASLERLKTDYVDLYQLHWPDPATPMEETLGVLDELVRAGKVRYIGCSNLPAWQMVEAMWIARQRGLAAFISCQEQYSLLWRDPEREKIPAMKAYGLGLLPHFPLASGMLTGKYHRGVAPPAGTRLATVERLAARYIKNANWDIVERLEKFCAERGRTLLELAISWLAAQAPIASVIAGATTPEQVEQNAASADWKLTAEELDEVDRLTKRE
jgi:aryl-alcohol dehydrogenase-like predicted oxidoreductase